VSSRCEHASLILTSNLPFARWGDVCGDQVVAAEMIDRIVHHADVLTLKDRCPADLFAALLASSGSSVLRR
jgi:DNA replication protein DnaC